MKSVCILFEGHLICLSYGSRAKRITKINVFDFHLDLLANYFIRHLLIFI